MQALIRSEVGEGPAEREDGEGADAGEAPHLELMREKSLAGYDDLSDVGNLRYYPRGKLIRDQLIDYVSDLVVDYGGMPVETPIMYDLGARSIREHAEEFGERQYRFESGDRRMMLRFAACFGQFSILRDMFISEGDLPLRLYEMSTYSFRREQQGEVLGLKRLRAFTMPDMHTACRDVDEAREEFEHQATLALKTGDDLGIDFSVIDARGNPIENPTVQIDVESAERFDIEYSDGTDTHHPPILHYSPSGGIERVMAALLETAATQDVPRLPTWLAPTQVRFVPVGDEHVEFCDELVDELEATEIRADVDEREESVGKRIARAERDWVPYYVVVGDRELDDEVFGVNERATGEETLMTLEELRTRVLSDVGELPRNRRYLPRHVSRHPNFTGS
jgi:threonyl-tRNA synthetase